LLVPGEAVKPRIYKIIAKMRSKNTLDMFSWCLCGRRGRDRMVVEFTTTCTTIAYSCEFESRWWRGVLDTT
jgi:hypothetical protein